LGGEHISAPLDPRFTFDNFVVGKPNELAAAARRVAEAPSSRSTRCSSTAASGSARRI
jgi:chromosomal replication initiation ATPase DnaA